MSQNAPVVRETPSVLISVATYKRPHLLRALLDSLDASGLPPCTRVCVVDNDADGSGREAATLRTAPLTYVREPKPGIAAARNRGLDEIRADDDYIVFVDDDERVTEGWLTRLLATQRSENADVVAGPVVSVFGDGTPAWIVRGGFIQRARFRTGDTVLSPATNNTLLRIDFLRRHPQIRFDEAFSLTGGSDTVFFREIRDRGARMVWCDEAAVHEDVPESRASFAWVIRRGIREGNVSGRLKLRAVSRVRLGLAGLARIAFGVARQIRVLPRTKGLEAKSVAYVTRGLGWVGTAAGRNVVEYSRATTSRQDKDH